MKPLSDIRVLDFSKTLAGPLCTQALGDLGAEVIKVEPLGVGDETRGWPPFRTEGLGTVFLSVNRNKRSIAIDLKTEDGRALAHQLAKTADIAIESFATGVAERLGVDAATLQSHNDRLIHCSISGFGRTGPLRNSPGYDVILQAFTGIMSLTGDENGGHIRSPISPVDQTAGTHALTGILAALLERNKTGKGTTIQVSLFETALGLLRYNIQSFWERGVQPAKCGSSHEALCPYQAFEAADGPMMLGVANDNLWRKFCALAGLEQIVDDPRFRTNADRVQHRAETLATHVQAALEKHTVAWWNDKLAAIGVPCSPINTLEQVLSHPHTESSGVVLDYVHPVGGRTKAIGQPFRLGQDERTVGLPPPMHGQHTREVLEEIGLSSRQIEELRNAKVIA